MFGLGPLVAIKKLGLVWAHPENMRLASNHTHVRLLWEEPLLSAPALTIN